MWKNTWPELPEERTAAHLHHQRRPHPHLAVQPHGQPAGALSGHRSWLDEPTDHNIWRTRLQHPGRGTVAHPRSCRERLVDLRPQAAQGADGKPWGATVKEIARAEEVLDPEALTIGFARRFATYKRGTLLFRNLDRLARILNDKDRPVQILFAGKAHPRDHGGKELIRRDHPRSAAGRSFAAGSSSSKTTTSTSPATWCRAWTCGSTRRAGRWRPAAPAA